MYSTESDSWKTLSGGKPNPGTRKDRRLKRNKKRRKARAKTPKPVKSKGRGHAVQGFVPIAVEWRYGK